VVAEANPGRRYCSRGRRSELPRLRQAVVAAVELESVADLLREQLFEVARDDIAEVHLHPRDLRGAIVSLSRPAPPTAWPWGGPE
jgi:hypothetical protein